MHRRASSWYGSTSASVGQASRHNRQFPQRSGGGGSPGARLGARSSVVRIAPRNSHEPSASLIRQVLFASQPSPAYFAATRSTTGPVSTYARASNGASENAARIAANSASSFSP